jgi:malyl-CoA/(S)-citramalyl-CoA lyase
MLEKAPSSGADVVFLDLEDAVAPDDKAQARKNVIEALNDLDWSGCAVSVRINGLDTHYCYRDIVDVVEQAGDKLDTILIPKVGTPADILFVSTLLEQIEAAAGGDGIRRGRLCGIHAGTHHPDGRCQPGLLHAHPPRQRGFTRASLG